MKLSLRLRKFIGMIALVTLVVIWALVWMAIAQGRVQFAPEWVQALYYVVAGLGWVLPAAGIIYWMERPSLKAD